MTATIAHTDPTLTILSDQAHALIRDTVKASNSRAQLERAVVQAINGMGKTVDEVSAATGLTPADIRGMLARPVELDLDALTGAR